MKKRSIRIIASSLCTTGTFLTEGCRYTYKPGIRKIPVILEKIVECKERLVLKLFLIEERRSIEVCHQYTDTPYLDTIRLFDYDEYDYGLPELTNFLDKEIEIISRDKPEYSKENFLNSLTPKQLRGVLQHFEQCYGSWTLGNMEYKLTFLAWLQGEGHFIARRGFLLYSPDEVAIDLQDYNGLPGGRKIGIPDFEQLRQHYYLDLLYKTVFLLT